MLLQVVNGPVMSHPASYVLLVSLFCYFTSCLVYSSVFSDTHCPSVLLASVIVCPAQDVCHLCPINPVLLLYLVRVLPAICAGLSSYL